jgi:hypothetical protein
MPDQKRSLHNPHRFRVIVLLIGANAALSVSSFLTHRYPMGLGAILCLIPILLREIDLRKGRPLRKMDSFLWSCYLGGILFTFVLPILVR